MKKISLFFLVNKVHTQIVDDLLDKVREIFNISKSIRLISQVLGMSWINPILGRVTTSINNLFIGLRLPFLSIV